MNKIISTSLSTSRTVLQPFAINAIYSYPGIETLQRRRSSQVNSKRPSPLRHFSSSSQETTPPPPPKDAATILQGPSLLTATGVNRPSPSLFFLPGLRSTPFWTAPPNTNQGHRVAYNDPTVTRILTLAESQYELILSEYLAAITGVSPGGRGQWDKPLESDYDAGSEHGTGGTALHDGKWDWHSLVTGGVRRGEMGRRCPGTVKFLEGLGEDLFGTPFSYVFFSTLRGGAKIKPHSGPMNLRLRFHLPLIVPPGDCGINVGGQHREWIPGKALVLDDSYIHEVWNNSDEPRVILLFDIWHPDVRKEERVRIEKMFDYAKGQGWIGKGG